MQKFTLGDMRGKCVPLIASLLDVVGWFSNDSRLKVNARRASTAAFDSPTTARGHDVVDCHVAACVLLSSLQSTGLLQ